MKYYRQTLYALCGLLLLTVGLLVYLLYVSGTENQKKEKLTAEVLLKHCAGIWLESELAKEGIPQYSVDNGTKKERRTKRYLMLAEGGFTIEVDSLKDERSLFIPESSENGCIRILFMIGKPSIKNLNRLWQESLDNKLSGYNCGLELVYQFPNGRKGNQSAYTGDSTLYSSRHKLGDYYLDDMYYLEVAAYLSMPPVWRCVSWGDMKILLCMVVVLACIVCIILIWIKNRTMPDCSVPLPQDNEADLVRCITDGKYQIGREIFWNEKEKTITFRGSTQHCPNQSCILLSAFVRAEGSFISNTQISEICSWNPGDTGVSFRRRSAMTQLRRYVLKDKESHVSVKSEKNEMGENGYCLVAI